MDFSFSEFCKEFPSGIVETLEEDGFDNLPALLSADRHDTDGLKLKKGHVAVIREAIKTLQLQHGEGPLRTPVSTDRGDLAGPDLARLLGSLTVAAEVAQAQQRPAGGCHQIVDFVSSSLFAEEEVALGGGVTLKLNPKPKLDKVSPAMWITANSRIMVQMLDESGKNFDVRAYLQYTEMGELAARYTWQSVLLFDEEYRQRQAKQGFPWGTDAPHLGTVMLRDRGPKLAPQQKKPTTGGNANRSRPIGPSGKDLCHQFNRGTCQYGARCQYEHVCSTCGSSVHAGCHHQATSPASAVATTVNKSSNA